jgi:hypothetical protein
MTAEAQRDTLCKALGWTYDPVNDQVVFVKDGDIVGYDWPSLDAIHEAEARLHPWQHTLYQDRLMEAVTPMGKVLDWFNMVTATHEQRLEAMVRTMGLWTDNP